MDPPFLSCPCAVKQQSCCQNRYFAPARAIRSRLDCHPSPLPAAATVKQCISRFPTSKPISPATTRGKNTRNVGSPGVQKAGGDVAAVSLSGVGIQGRKKLRGGNPDSNVSKPESGGATLLDGEPEAEVSRWDCMARCAYPTMRGIYWIQKRC